MDVDGISSLEGKRRLVPPRSLGSRDHFLDLPRFCKVLRVFYQACQSRAKMTITGQSDKRYADRFFDRLSTWISLLYHICQVGREINFFILSIFDQKPPCMESICRSRTEGSRCRFRSNGQVCQESRSDVIESRRSLTRIEHKHGRTIGSSPSRGAIAPSCLVHRHS